MKVPFYIDYDLQSGGAQLHQITDPASEPPPREHQMIRRYCGHITFTNSDMGVEQNAMVWEETKALPPVAEQPDPEDQPVTLDDPVAKPDED